MVALSVVGSAILLFACERNEEAEPQDAAEILMTEYSENLSVVMSQNGRRSYHFKTPLLEGYQLAREPYREFRKGVEMTTYKDDSLSSVDAVLTANYAIHYENRELWEARGDVVVKKSDGKTLYTQQLFWNARTKKIYSNVDSKIVQNDGRDVFIGEGFESDEEFKDWRFRRMKGRMEVEVKPAGADSTTVVRPPAAPARPAPARTDRPADEGGQGNSGGSAGQGQHAGETRQGNEAGEAGQGQRAGAAEHARPARPTAEAVAQPEAQRPLPAESAEEPRMLRQTEHLLLDGAEELPK